MVLGISTLCGDDLFLCVFGACHVIALAVWVTTLVTDKHSHMDKLWPILPSVYAWSFLLLALYANPSKDPSIKLKSQLQDVKQPALMRLYILVGFITLWSIRLFYVFYRRGYYSWSFEDHRWDLVKARFGYPQKKLAFHIFNFFFMAILQNYILFGYSLPVWYLLTNKSTQTSLNVVDYVVLSGYVVFYLIEAIADEQQWRFQTNKHKWLKDRSLPYSDEEIEDFKRGFLCKGLFAYSRHPNYFGDIFLWLSVYFVTISAKFPNYTSVWDFLNYSMFGAVIMVYLFQRSSQTSEKATAAKYPEYAHYKKHVNRIWFGLCAYKPKNN